MSNRHTRVSLEGVPEEEGHLEVGGVTVICLLQLLLIANNFLSLLLFPTKVDLSNWSNIFSREIDVIETSIEKMIHLIDTV